MEKTLKEPRVRVNGRNSSHDVVGEMDLLRIKQPAKVETSSDYGVADDYYEIFGNNEELIP